MGYKTVPDEYDFSTEFPTWIIAFCPDLDTWFVTNKRFFYYEYGKEFDSEQDGIEFFRNNAKIFFDIETKMNVYKPSFYECGVWLENINELIEVVSK